MASEQAESALASITARLAKRSGLAEYDKDFHLWALEQSEALSQGRFEDLDLVNLADEVGSLAKIERRALESDLKRVIQHLLKWDYQADRRSRSWSLTVAEHRRRIGRLLTENPSLGANRREAVAEAFESALGDALSETDLPRKAFPAANPYAWDDIMTRPVLWPEDEAS